MAIYKITLTASGWTQTTSALWYDTEQPGKVFDDSGATSEVSSITPPWRELYRFKGFRGTVGGQSNTLCIDADGSFAEGMSGLISGTGNKSLSVWYDSNTARKITLNPNGGSDGLATLYRPYTFTAGDPIYSDWLCEHEVTSIAGLFPKKKCHECTGFYNSSSGSTQYINVDGTIRSELRDNNVTTVYAQWDRVSWPITLNKNSGSGGPDAIYGGVSGGFWADDLCTERIYSVEIPARDGYTFYGYWQTAGGSGNLYVKADGTINFSQSVITTGAYTIYAYWDANTYTLAFDPNGGTCDTASKTVKFASAVGVLPVPSHSKADFVAWRVNGQQISSSSPWTIASDATAIAEWDFYFGDLTDWFGLASSTLIPISSDAGDNRQRIVTRHYGRYKYGAYQGADATSGIWRNPTVRYMVVGDMTLSLFLGDAFAATTSGGGMTITGYMITSVSIDTRSGQFPIVTVQGTANEGADAINLFTVKVPILARARAQNLLGAISGGGDLQACSLVATCDPVVLAENMMPCASDVVGGRFELNAETLAPNREAAPTMAAASTSDNINYGGFTLIDSPAIGEGANYRRYSVTARKEIS